MAGRRARHAGTWQIAAAKGGAMAGVLGVLAEHPVLLVAVLLGIGAALGEVRIKGVGVGPAAVLFTAIGVSALADAQGVGLAIPAILGTVGLVLFTYCVGVQNGPGFFAGLRSGLVPMAGAVVVLVLAAGTVLGLGRLAGLSPGTIAGTFAGAATNTPALAAAIEVTGDSTDPTVGYSVAYVFGVLGMLVFAALALRSRRPDADPRVLLTNLTVRIEGDRPIRAADVVAKYGGAVTFSRIQHDESQPIAAATGEDVLHPGTLATVVGPRDLLEQIAWELGHPSSHALEADHRFLEMRRITLSRQKFAGLTVRELGLTERFGAAVSRVRRGDTDLVAHAELVLQPGDRLRVVAPSAQIGPITQYMGDSARGAADINPVGLGIGLALGVTLGLVAVPIPGGSFALGAAAGTLLVGLVFGRLGRVGPVVTTMANNASSSLSQLGILVFLIWAGVTAGGQFGPALAGGVGAHIALVGAAGTVVVGTGVLVLGRILPGVGAARLAGILSGAQTQPAVLAFANERTEHDPRVSLGYATVFPVALVAKILLAQVLGHL